MNDFHCNEMKRENEWKRNEHKAKRWNKKQKWDFDRMFFSFSLFILKLKLHWTENGQNTSNVNKNTKEIILARSIHMECHFWMLNESRFLFGVYQIDFYDGISCALATNNKKNERETQKSYVIWTNSKCTYMNKKKKQTKQVEQQHFIVSIIPFLFCAFVLVMFLTQNYCR